MRLEDKDKRQVCVHIVGVAADGTCFFFWWSASPRQRCCLAKWFRFLGGSKVICCIPP